MMADPLVLRRQLHIVSVDAAQVFFVTREDTESPVFKRHFDIAVKAGPVQYLFGPVLAHQIADILSLVHRIFKFVPADLPVPVLHAPAERIFLDQALAGPLDRIFRYIFFLLRGRAAFEPVETAHTGDMEIPIPMESPSSSS